MNWNKRYSNGYKSEYYSVRYRMEQEKPTGHRLADYHDRLGELAYGAWGSCQIARDHRRKAKAIRAAVQKGISDQEERKEELNKIPKLFDPDNPPT